MPIRLCLFAIFCSLFSRAAAPSFEADSGTVEPFTLGATLFSDRAYTALAVPPVLTGARFIRVSIDTVQTLVCTQPGTLYAVTPADHPANSLADELRADGFEQLPERPLQLFGAAPEDRALIFRKPFAAGETLTARKWVILFAHGDLRLSLLPSSSRPLGGRENWRENDGATLP
nr:hypothetical protein [Kiritimatiellia bacterium]